MQKPTTSNMYLNSPYKRGTKYDISPGKQKLSDRELEKLSLQGIFDFPHNKVNNQLVNNIDLKEADKRYYEKFKSTNKEFNQSESIDASNFNRYKREIAHFSKNNVQRNYMSHHRSHQSLDQEALDARNEILDNRKEFKSENPYEDRNVNQKNVITHANESTHPVNVQNTNSRNSYQDLLPPQGNKSSNVIY